MKRILQNLMTSIKQKKYFIVKEMNPWLPAIDLYAEQFWNKQSYYWNIIFAYQVYIQIIFT